MRVPQTRYRIPTYFGDISNPQWHIVNLEDEIPLSRTNLLSLPVIADLNGQWVLATSSFQSIIDAAGSGYTVVMSNSNYHVARGVATMYVRFGDSYDGSLVFKIMNRAEGNYDYPTITLSNGSTLYNSKLNTSYFTNVPVTYTGELVMTVSFSKDYSGDTDLDRAFLAIPEGVEILIS